MTHIKLPYNTLNCIPYVYSNFYWVYHNCCKLSLNDDFRACPGSTFLQEHQPPTKVVRLCAKNYQNSTLHSLISNENLHFIVSS